MNNDVNEEALIRGMVQHGFRLGFPEPLESHFVASHDREALLTLRRAALGLLLFAVFVGVVQGTFIWRLTPSNLVVHDLRVWTLGFWSVLVVLSLALAATRIESQKRWFIPLRWLACFTAVLSVLICSWSLQYVYFARLSGYLVLLVIMAVFSFSRMRLFPAFIVVMAAVLVAFGVGLLLNQWPDWLEFFQYFGLSMAYGVLLGGLLEYRDRRIFLQERLLVLEKLALENMSIQQDKLARHDRLTGLMNPYYFKELMEREWERARRERQSLSLLILDIHLFGAFNQRYGYAAGDRCLAALARVLERICKRAVDVSARFQNDEYLLLLPNTSAVGARAIMETLELEFSNLEILHEDEPAGLLRVDMGLSSMVPHVAQEPRILIESAQESLRLVRESTSDTSIVW
ncbi:MAG: diguanylate cyclase [Pseudomonadales bacterium]|nr:diguanylate cyclase [Pseudomonadales bacterium]